MLARSRGPAQTESASELRSVAVWRTASGVDRAYAGQEEEQAARPSHAFRTNAETSRVHHAHGSPGREDAAGGQTTGSTS